MRDVYQRCCSYAYKCNPFLYRDLVHSAWLNNFNKDGSNLFDKPVHQAFRFIRNAWFNEIKRGKFMYDGEIYQKEFVSNGLLVSHTPLPDSQLITKDFYEHLYREIDNYQTPTVIVNGGKLGNILDPKRIRDFINLYEQGYSVAAIAKELRASRQTISNYKNKVKTILSRMQGVNNPFSGNKAKPIKSITLKQYEDKYKDEYVYDFNREWCDENETSKLVVHREREEYILVKLTKD